MIIIVGLGNPGEKFENTRHNIGRETAESFVKNYGLQEFSSEKKWNSQVSEGKIGREKIAIVLPDTFMNKSGRAVAPAARFYKIKPKALYVIHDDADLPLVRAKHSFGKHSAGHKGVESVIRALKTRDFWRFRIGIAGRRDIPAEKLVLKKFTPDELKLPKKIQKKTIEAIETAATDGPEKTMNSYNS
jgi:PTH1 family peptidyl-tRNA hydrolase